MRIHAHATVTAVATLALMIMGSLVHGTGSSLACPDWPLCHGTVFPRMAGGVEFEHTHRLMAAAVIVLIGSLWVRTLRAPDRRARWLAGAGSGLVLVQATLGGLTVIFRLPPAISIAHLAVSMGLLSLLVVLAVRLTPGPTAASRPRTAPFLAAAALVYAQVVLGAVVRHTGAVLACTGFPLCTGEVWPEASLARLQVVHRSLGLMALSAVFLICIPAARRAATGSRRLVAIAPVVLATIQVILGAAVVLTYAPLDLVTLHHLGGALLLASLVAAAAIEARTPPTPDPGAEPARAGLGLGWE